MTRCRSFLRWVGIVAFALTLDAGDACGQAPKIYLDVEDVIARPGNVVPVSVFIQNLGDSIQAFQMGITLDRPDIMAFESDTVIQTCYYCADSACTSVIARACTVAVVPVTPIGTLVQNWEFVQANTFGSYDLRLTGIADTDFDDAPGPIPPFTSGILIKVVGHIYCDIPDTLTDRTAVLTISPVNTFFSNTVGDLIRPLDLSTGNVTILVTQRSDINSDGATDAVDLALLVDVIFFGADMPCPPSIADLNCDSTPDVLDLAWIIDYIFFGGPPPPC